MEIANSIYLITIALFIIAVGLSIISSIWNRARKESGRLPPMQTDLEIERLLSILYESMETKGQRINIPHRDWGEPLFLSKDQEYYITSEALRRNLVRPSWSSSGDGEQIFSIMGSILARRPPILKLSDREYEERVVNAGTRIAVTAGPAQLTESQITRVIDALRMDQFDSAAIEIQNELRQGNRKSATETIRNIASFLADTTTTWINTQNIISDIFG